MCGRGTLRGHDIHGMDGGVTRVIGLMAYLVGRWICWGAAAGWGFLPRHAGWRCQLGIYEACAPPTKTQ